MKKFLLMAAVATTLVNCSSDFDLSEGQGGGGVSDVIGFQVQGRNSIKRATLQKANHYNFGVFAYKSTDQTNNIMDNYLVGYLDNNKGYTKAGSTTDDPNSNVDGKSNWMYEGMGWGQFHGTYAGENVAEGTKYASNNQYQYLRYWDKSAPSTCFYAYVPYLNAKANGNKTVSYVDGTAKGTDTDPTTGAALNTDTYVMTFPNGTIKHGYDDVQAYEYMYASTQVAAANYGHDVQLEFKRLNAKVNIKFWEDIPGYSVHMIDLGNVTDATGTKHYTISAVPSIKEAGQGTYGYKLGAIYTKNGVKIKFNTDATVDQIKQYQGETTDKPLEFTTPTAATIGESRIEATLSPTTYFAIPKYNTGAVLSNTAANYDDHGRLNTDLAKTGLTFHVSYELISTTGEKITVKDATVHVPANYCEWRENTRYTYIFKITTNSNGTTGSETPKPTDPSVPTEMALYPIVFDNCTVEDWVEEDYEWDITEGADNTWYDVQLGDGEYSFKNTIEKRLHVKVLRTSKNPTDNGETLVKELTLAANDLSVTGPNGAIITNGRLAAGAPAGWSITDNIITVPAHAATGKYTVTYTASDKDVNANNPATYTENFFVGTECSVNTNLNVVATNAVEPNTYLQILTVTDGQAAPQPTSTDNLEIIYPINLKPTEKAKVTVALKDGKAVVQVAQDAKAGKYELVYKVKNVLPEDVEVKKVFEVKDYGLSLDKNIINLDNTNHTITASSDFAGGELSYAKSDDGTATVTSSGMTITVNNNVAEGTYNVSYVVNKGTVSEATYKTSFEVKNTYEVKLDKGTIRRDLGRPTIAEYGTDQIVISTFKNGVADNKRSSALTIKDAEDTDVTSSKFHIAPNDTGNTYVLQVKGNPATANGTYTIEFKGQDDKIVKTTFIVQD
ncbi:MAG: hypothetical protein MSS47_06210 [Bacteroidales bacterium]|nr:hypothetical protein [Bacteroidales bacterium]